MLCDVSTFLRSTRRANWRAALLANHQPSAAGPKAITSPQCCSRARTMKKKIPDHELRRRGSSRVRNAILIVCLPMEYAHPSEDWSHWNESGWDFSRQQADKTALHIGPRCGPNCKKSGFAPVPACDNLQQLRVVPQ